MSRNAQANPESLSVGGRLAFLAKDSVVYGGGAMLGKVFGLVTFPLLTRNFSIEDYGLINYFLVLSGVLAVAFVFGQDSAVARYFYEHADMPTRRRLITQSLIFQMACMAALLPAVWLFFRFGPHSLRPSSRAATLLTIVLLQTPALVLINFSVNLLKWTFSRRRFLVMTLGPVFLNMMLLVGAIRWVGIDAQELFFLILGTNALFALIGVYFVKNWIAAPEGFDHLRPLVKYAVPFGGIGILATGVTLAERTVVGRVLGMRDLGIYAAAAAAAGLLSLLAGAFQTAWGPFSLSIHKNSDAERTYNWVFKAVVIGVCSGALLVSALAGPLIVFLASDRYAAASAIVFPLAMGIGIQTMSWVTEVGIVISKKSYLGFYGYAVSVVVGFAAMYALGVVWGAYGVAMGAMLGYAARAVTQSFLAFRAHRLSWPFGAGIVLTTITVGTGIFAHGLEGVFPGSAVVVFLAGAFLLPVIGCFVFFGSEERSRMANLALHAWNARFSRREK